MSRPPSLPVSYLSAGGSVDVSTVHSLTNVRLSSYTAKENVPSVEDSSAPAAVEGESREIPGVAAAATEEVKKEEDKPVKEKKVKGPTVLEKMKGLFHSGEKKEKKEKAGEWLFVVPF